MLQWLENIWSIQKYGDRSFHWNPVFWQCRHRVQHFKPNQDTCWRTAHCDQTIKISKLYYPTVWQRKYSRPLIFPIGSHLPLHYHSNYKISVLPTTKIQPLGLFLLNYTRILIRHNQYRQPFEYLLRLSELLGFENSQLYLKT